MIKIKIKKIRYYKLKQVEIHHPTHSARYHAHQAYQYLIINKAYVMLSQVLHNRRQGCLYNSSYLVTHH